MSDYLIQFQSKTRRKADLELIRRWECHARWYGDRDIKPQASQAKRTATQLDNACTNFSHLAPEQELAFKAAASAMRKLANDLVLLAAWAKDYRAFCKAIMDKERADELEATASKRWGSDTAALAFEQSLVLELQTSEGRAAMGQWMLGRGQCQGIASQNFHTPFNSSFYSNDNNPRARLAELMQEAAQSSRNRHTDFSGKHVHISWSDYEAYLAYRKEVAKTTARVVQMAGAI